jgi:hypothetical protein
MLMTAMPIRSIQQTDDNELKRTVLTVIVQEGSADVVA